MPNGIAFGNGLFVTVGPGGQTHTSPDAINWTLRNYVTGNHLSDIAYFNDQFVAIGGGSTIVTSPDGTTWQTNHAGTLNQLNRLVQGKDRLVAVGGSYFPAREYATITTSTNGQIWSALDLPTSGPLASVTYGQGQFVAVGDGMTGLHYGTILSSPDGLTWTPRQSGLTGEGRWVTGPGEFHLTGVSYFDGVFRAFGYARFTSGAYFDFTFTSPDGVRWTVREGGNALIHAVYGQDKYVQLQGRGQIASSPEGTNWTVRTTGTGAPLYDLTYDRGQFVAVGDHTLLSSPDGLTWTVRPGGSGYQLRAVAYGKNRFLAVGNGGVILQSAPLEMKLEPLQRLTTGGWQGRVSNVESTHCVIETSANFIDWQVLTNLTTSDGWAPFTDPAATNINYRFYRAKVIKP